MEGCFERFFFDVVGGGEWRGGLFVFGYGEADIGGWISHILALLFPLWHKEWGVEWSLEGGKGGGEGRGDMSGYVGSRDHNQNNTHFHSYLSFQETNQQKS